MIEFLVDEENAGLRLDQFLSENIPQTSRTKVKSWIKEGLVLVDDTKLKASAQIHEGQKIEVHVSTEPPKPIEVEPEHIPLDIVYEDEDILLVNKDAGMVVHPGSGISSGTLVNALVYHINELSEVGGRERPGIVHRLDKGTTGLILVAKNDEAHLDLTGQWQKGAVTKVYQALVWGTPNPTEGEIKSHIGRHPTDRKRMAAEVEHGKFAHSRFKVVDSFPEASKVNIHILTGRTHQIRVHLAHLGHPVVGDALYGGARHRSLSKSFEFMPEYPMLHAGLLRFQHPASGKLMTFKQEPPLSFLRCLELLRTWP